MQSRCSIIRCGTGIICWTQATSCRLCVGIIELRPPCDDTTGSVASRHQRLFVSKFNMTRTQATLAASLLTSAAVNLSVVDLLSGHYTRLVCSSMSVDPEVILITCTIIDFPNLGLTYNGGWCTATEQMKPLSQGLLAKLT